MKKSRDFDQWLKESLEQYEPGTQNRQAVWNRLQQSLKTFEKQEDRFDRSIRDKLAGARVHAPKADWNHFLVKFRERNARRKRIMGIRIMELSLLLLLVLTLDRFFKMQSVQGSHPTELVAQAEPQSEPRPISDQNQQKTQARHKNINPVSRNPFSPENISTRSSDPHQKSRSTADRIHSTKRKRITSPSSSESYHEGEIPESAPLPNSNTSQKSNAETSQNPVLNPSIQETTDERKDEPKMDGLQTRDPKGLPFQTTEPQIKIQTLNSGVKALKIWISTRFGAGINIIRTPQDHLLLTQTKIHSGNWYQTGLSILFDHGRMILETGLYFSQLTNQPKTKDIYKAYDGSFYQCALLKNSYQMLEIPVLASVVLWQDGAWKLISGAGLSVSANLNSKYDIRNEKYQIPPGQGISGIPRTSYVLEKNYNQGLLQNEGMNSNSFANLLLHGRMLYKINHLLTAFGECQYAHMLSSNGFGPLYDQYHRLGFSLGVQSKF